MPGHCRSFLGRPWHMLVETMSPLARSRQAHMTVLRCLKLSQAVPTTARGGAAPGARAAVLAVDRVSVFVLLHAPNALHSTSKAIRGTD